MYTATDKIVVTVITSVPQMAYELTFRLNSIAYNGKLSDCYHASLAGVAFTHNACVIIPGNSALNMQQ